MSQTQVAEAVDKHHFQVARFLTQNDLEALPGNDFKSHTFTIDRDDMGRGGRGQIKTVSIDLAFKFWMWQASRKPYGFSSIRLAAIMVIFTINGLSLMSAIFSILFSRKYYIFPVFFTIFIHYAIAYTKEWFREILLVLVMVRITIID